MIPFRMSKSCKRCNENLCILYVKFIDPYEPWWPGKWQQSMKRKLFDNPACPRCYDEIEKENKEKKKQEEDLEILGTEMKNTITIKIEIKRFNDIFPPC